MIQVEKLETNVSFLAAFRTCQVVVKHNKCVFNASVMLRTVTVVQGYFLFVTSTFSCEQFPNFLLVLFLYLLPYRRDIKVFPYLSVTEVECEVSSQVEYSLQALWGVSIRELHLALWKPWSTLRDASLNGNLLQGHAQYLTLPQTYPFPENEILLSILNSRASRLSSFADISVEIERVVNGVLLIIP